MELVNDDFHHEAQAWEVGKQHEVLLLGFRRFLL